MRDDDASREAQEALLRALARTADARCRNGRYSEAERLYGRALGLAEEIFGTQHPDVAAILHRMAALKETK